MLKGPETLYVLSLTSKVNGLLNEEGPNMQLAKILPKKRQSDVEEKLAEIKEQNL